MSVFFTSDTHFGHPNILKHTNRWKTFCNKEEKAALELNLAIKISSESIEKMNQELINRWNSKVQKNDTVYFLGDMFLYMHRDKSLEILKRLNGQIHFIEGNHDKIAKQLRNEFLSYSTFSEIKVGEKKVVLCHYAMRVWNGSHHGTYHLYGHSHGTLPDDPNALSFDVGVDCHNYYPISFEEVQAIMKTKTFKPIDHHGSNQL